ncbi:alpha/beta-hydrolase [Coprinopsis marcescibilis]|uniref:Alpha/beta-hydrolase n=1 Tax=Coprinopsis marcescibilis TaxID=230819 RepID=A0A5C3KRK6_COPMA|nr:alpha/beta-hydrolase [Coprinopsis marcescibilis]
MIKRGYLFILVDYSLLPPATGYDILEDINDLWSFLTNPGLCLDFPISNNSEDCSVKVSVRVKKAEIIVAGASAGGLCAYLSAMHCTNPMPKAVLSLYGMCGQVLSPHYLQPKYTPFFRGREILDPNDYLEFLYPRSRDLEVTTSSALAYYPKTHHIPGFPANPRMLLARLYLQLGTFLDYYTGSFEPSLSVDLRGAVDDWDSEDGSELVSGQGGGRAVGDGSFERLVKKVPVLAGHLLLFPQFHVSTAEEREWPRILLVHGSEDTAVPVEDSRNMERVWKNVGACVRFLEVEGEEHSFDLAGDAEQKLGWVFEEVVEFLCQGA